MNNKAHEFTEGEILLMKNVAFANKTLSRKFGVPEELVREYRRSTLRMCLAGLFHEFAEIQHKVDWSQDSINIAKSMKVSPLTVDYWKLKVASKLKKSKKKPRITLEQQEEIARSDMSACNIARSLGISNAVVHRIRKINGLSHTVGRPKKLAPQSDDIDWKRKPIHLARILGVSWVTANRMRTEMLLKQKNYKPLLPAQPCLPGFEGFQGLPSPLDNVDWSESTDLLTAYLGLEKFEVARLKHEAVKKRRQKK